MLHRDIKPENTLLTLEYGRHVVKLCDFGVARIIATKHNKPLNTVAGTPAHMAPELFSRNVKYDCSGSVDVFAAGILFYLLIEARPGQGMYFEDDEDMYIGKRMWVGR